MTIPDFLERILRAGISITIEPSDKYNSEYYFDLNLQSKSHMHLYQEGDSWFIAMRYDKIEKVQDYYDLLGLAKSGMHGRDFINAQWADLLIKEGYLKKIVKTTVSYR